MKLNFKNLKKMPVETASGIKLGHVSDIILETEGQLITQYEVKHSIISGKTYLVSRDQIVHFEDKKIIVDDNVEKIEEKSRDMARDPDFITSGKNTPINPEPISMRKTA